MKGKSIFGRPQVLAHRMLVSGYPENTIISLQKAIEIGVEWVEFDVRVLADGELVSHHGRYVDSETLGQVDVSNLTLKEIKEIDVGKNFPFGFIEIPTVEEILQELVSNPRKIKADMHIPGFNIPEKLFSLLDKYNLKDRCFFAVDNFIMAEYIREDVKDVDARICLVVDKEMPGLKENCIDYNISYLCVKNINLNAEFIDRIHGYRDVNPVYVHSYPANDESGWKKLIEMGIDVIETDFPGALIEFIQNYQEKKK
ncbi:MAG: glycerophosphodiester phosphodiesterase [Candidatus Hodarchaeota archaeon]